MGTGISTRISLIRCIWRKEDIISSRFDIELQQNILLDIFCGSSSTLFSAVVLSCATCYMYFFFLENTLFMYIYNLITPIILSDFINLTQVHNFTDSAQDIFTFRRLSVFAVSITRILQVVMQIMKHFAMYY